MSHRGRVRENNLGAVGPPGPLPKEVGGVPAKKTVQISEMFTNPWEQKNKICEKRRSPRGEGIIVGAGKTIS